MRTAVRFPARMTLEQILDGLARDDEFQQLVTRWERIPPRQAVYAPFPEWLDGRIAASLRRRGILSLYSHQAEALETAHAGKYTVVVTPTASGKTLCYDLPVLDAIAKDPSARALYLFPTKALAQDQLAELERLSRDIDLELKTFTYDGDTPPQARARGEPGPALWPPAGGEPLARHPQEPAPRRPRHRGAPARLGRADDRLHALARADRAPPHVSPWTLPRAAVAGRPRARLPR